MASGIEMLAGDERADDDGLETGPPPEYEALRMIVADRISWLSMSFASRNGNVYQRHFNPWSGEWEWTAKKSIAICKADDEPMVSVVCGADGRSMRLARAVALAWLEPPRIVSKLQVVQGQARASDDELVDTLAWCARGGRPRAVRFVPVPAAVAPRDDDEWTVLRYTWFNDSGEAVQVYSVDSHGPCWVSKRGWFRGISGVPTLGNLTPEGRRWVHIPGASAAWLDRAVIGSFEQEMDDTYEVRHVDDAWSDNCLSRLEWRPRPSLASSRLRVALGALVMKQMLSDDERACNELDCSRETLWVRLRDAIRLADIDVETTLEWLIEPSLLVALRQMDEEVAVPFRELHERIAHVLVDDESWNSLHSIERYGQLRCAVQGLHRIECAAQGQATARAAVDA